MKILQGRFLPIKTTQSSRDKFMDQKKKPIQPMTIQPGDYYVNEQGLMVFTAQYHLRRGYCCGSGCRHCPYSGKKR